MKKISLLALFSTVFAIVGCSNQSNSKDSSTSIEVDLSKYSLVCPDGAPALALANMLESDRDVKKTPKIEITSATELSAKVVKSDFAICPINLAANLYNKTGDYLLAASVTNGNMYLVGSKAEENFDSASLKGNVLYAIGQGSVVDFVLKSTLNKLNYKYETYTGSESSLAADTVYISYQENGQGVIANIAQAKTNNTQAYGYLAEPAVTTMVSKDKGYQVADMQKMFQEANNSATYGFAQAALIVKKSVYKQDPNALKALLNELKATETYLNNLPEEGNNIAELIKSNYAATTVTTMSKDTIKKCNIKLYEAKDNYDYIASSLNACYEINPNSVANSVPSKDSGFYL